MCRYMDLYLYMYMYMCTIVSHLRVCMYNVHVHVYVPTINGYSLVDLQLLPPFQWKLFLISCANWKRQCACSGVKG